MHIIPAIDIINGQCVRLSQGDYTQRTIYHEDPLEVARMFSDAGLRRLHLVDLDGAKAGKVINWKVLENIATHTDLVIDFGGGIKSRADVELVFNSGAALATIGSLAVKQPDVFLDLLQHFGAERFFLGADVRGEMIAVHGWMEDTDRNIFDLIRDCQQAGVRQFFCTDIAKDGMMQGPSVVLYERLLQAFTGLQLTASGGVTNMDDLHQLQQIGCAGAIIGKAIYEGTITLDQLVSFDHS